MSVLRASSLAPVTLFVWSIRLHPSSAAQLRTSCRTLTIWSSERMSNRSRFVTAMERLRRVVAQCRSQELHAFLHVERRAHSVERESELDQGDRHGRAHADDHG